MAYKAALSFIDPLNGTAYQIGDAYSSADDEHSDYLLEHGLITQSLPTESQEEKPKRSRKRGAEDGTD